jgi:hypothetical protein
MKSQWTLERRAQQAAAIHRWKPWEQSTGPRTAEGKTIVSRNAFKGGKREALRHQMREFRQFIRAAAMALDRGGPLVTAKRRKHGH